MRARVSIVALAALVPATSFFGVACSVLFPLDGFGGSGGAGGAPGVGADAGDAGDAMDASDGSDATDAGDAMDASDASEAMDAGDGDADPCSGKADGVACGPAQDGCHAVDACKQGICAPGAALADGTQWDKQNPIARCCGGKPILTNTNDDCSVCGVKCNTAKGQSCKVQGANPGVYQCAGCLDNVDCWSGCCASMPGPLHVCADSDCLGNCPSKSICPAGAHCQMYFLQDGKNNVCTY